jgi:NAD(P) transhydrogenase subunit beta
MLTEGLVTVSYLAATILFILSLGGLSNPETARRGNFYGFLGMSIAILATVTGPHVTQPGYLPLTIAIVIGSAIGIFAAKKVKMTEMPELVALMHSLVGLAAVLVGYATYLDTTQTLTGAEKTIHEVEIYLGILIGAVTFSGRHWGGPLVLGSRSTRRSFAALCHDGDFAPLWYPHGHGHWRCRYAGCGLHAE